MRTRLRSKVTLLFLAFAVAIFAVAGTAMALVTDTSGDTSGTTSPSPTITSDKADYAPGELVTLTGSGWGAGESVNIYVEDDQGKTWSRNVDVTADDSGNITDSFNLPDWFVATYSVKATGASGAVATTSFTDALPTSTTLTSSQNPSTDHQAVTFTATVTCGSSTQACTFDDGTFTSQQQSITFKDGANSSCNGGTTLGTVSAANFGGSGTGVGNSRTATFTTNSLSVATHSIRACFTGGGSGTRAGDSVSSALSQVVNADTTAPSVAITSPSDDDTTTNSTINVSGTASDAAGIQGVKVNDNTATLGTGNSWSYNNLSLSCGENTITAVATDDSAAHNTASTSITVTRTCNTAPNATVPTFTPASPKTDDTLQASTTTSDADNNNVSVAWVWKITRGANTCQVNTDTSTAATPGARTSSLNLSQSYTTSNCTGASPPASINPNKGDTVIAEATPNDGTVNGTMRSSSVVIANSAPTCAAVSLTTNEDTTGSASPNCTDADGDTLTYSIVAQGTKGTASATSGQLQYVPFENENGSDSFTYRANDGTAFSDPATVNVIITPVDDPPTAVNDSATVQEDSGANAINVLANDTDIDGGPKTISSASDPANGTVALTGGTSEAHTGLTYQPDPNYCNDPPATNLDTFTYTLNGGSQGTVSVKVTCVNDAPTTPGAISSTESLNNDGTFTLSWGASTDVDSATITYTLEQRDNDDTGWSEVASGLTSASYTFGGTNAAELEGLWDFRVKAVDDYTTPASSAYRENLDLVKVDQTNPNAPTLSFATMGQSTKVTVNSVDWYKDSVKIDVADNDDPVNARDGSTGSGVNAASFPASFTVTTNGTSTASKTVKDNATNESAAGNLEVNVDAANPTLGACPTAEPFLVNSGQQSVGPISASDGESGIDSANSTLTKSVDTTSTGTKTVTFKAQDRVGHSVTKNCDYTVGAYDFVGFTSPVDSQPTMNSAKAGQAIPLKWRLMNNGTPVTNLQSVTVTASSLTCSLGTSTDLMEEYASGSSGLQNLGDGYYQFNWKTPTTYVKSCKSVQINGVGMQLKATQLPWFQFTK